MALEVGTRLGHYDVTALIGEGGMGQVYQATDTKLNRQVALKILPEAFVTDPDRLARFQREAQVLASLNHPNIAQIHGIEEEGGTRALVLELVEGPTLADRISKGPISVDEALLIAKQIAEALEAAHEAGVIHRDLKPANIKVREDGTVKVLDFGLAKALDPAPTGDPSQSPTLTAAATQMGVIMGTAAYMSPEQARGKPVDKRADIWAFGCVLYEMLTGTKPFAGDDVSQTLARVIDRDPDWDPLPTTLSPGFVMYLRRCLQRDPRQRLRDIGDVRLALEGAFETTADTVSAESAAPLSAREGRRRRWRLAIPMAGVGLVVGVLATWWAMSSSRPEPQPAMRLEAKLAGLGTNGRASEAALSPSGTHLAYSTVGVSGIYVRALEQLEGTLLVPGRAFGAFFSPDGQWVGFFTDTELRKIPVVGGAAQTVARVNPGTGGSWGPDETIIFSAADGLYRVSANGGEPEALTRLGEDEAFHAWPQPLPDGRAVLFTSGNSTSNFERARIEVLDLETSERMVVQEGSVFGRYVPTGHLVYVVDDTLFAIPFDLAALEGAGSAIPVLSGIAAPILLGGSQFLGGQFSMAASGTLAYLADSGGEPAYPVVWVDRQGVRTSLWAEPGEYGDPNLSPHGTQLALIAHRDQNTDVWVYDIERGVPRRLTTDAERDDDLVWSPDGQYLVFDSARDQSRSLYRVRADGSGEVEQLFECDSECWPESWSADGRFLAFSKESPNDIWVLPLNGDREPEPFATTGAAELQAAFSPNGRWIAYASDESGQWEVYVRPYPPAPGEWRISSDGGRQPEWAADGHELFYRTDSGIMVVAVEPDAEVFNPRPAEELFTGTFQGEGVGVFVDGEPYSEYDVAADGQRFVMFPRSEDDQAGNEHITLVFNWVEELKRLVPTN